MDDREIEDVRSALESYEERLKREYARLKVFKETGVSEWEQLTPEQWRGLLCTEINKLEVRIYREKEALSRLERIVENPCTS